MANMDQQKFDQIRQILESDVTLKGEISKLLSFLPYSEYQLIQFMSTPPNNVWQGTVPPPPVGFTSETGAIELGLFLYWFKNPGELNLSNFSFKEQLIILAIVAALDYILADSLMTTENYNFFKTQNGELIYEDGTVLSMEPFANFDQNWFIAFLNLAETAIHNLWYNNGVYPTTPPPAPIQLSGATAGTVNIAIIGDWGSGDATAQSLMNQVVSLNPDYIAHVGDVYYAGSPQPTNPNSSSYFYPNEELQNLNDLWPAAYNGKSFTLNSNHEMYSGGNGLFYDALGVLNTPAGSGTPFSAQQGSSCFALQFGGWTILGLDSAFMSSITSALMTGSIGGATGTQGQWIQSLKLNPATTIVLTHHNGFADDTCSGSPLWAEIRGALGGDPYAWYWGHVHNGIVYDTPITIPATPSTLLQPAIPSYTTSTYARCLGHAALPYGLGTSLAGQTGRIAWYANTPQPAPSKQLYNGFAVLTLSDNNGQLTITENFYDLGGTAPTWTKQIYPAS